MAEQFDVVIVGGGTGGYSAALRAGGLGLSVALIERDKVGGTCLHRGCVPTKALLHTAEVAESARHGSEIGVSATLEGVDVPKTISYKDKIVNTNWKGLQAALKGKKVTTFEGDGTFTGPNSVRVKTKDGEVDVEATKGFIIATGSRPRELPFAKTDGKLIINSDHMMTIEKQPKNPIVLGASAVGIEFATVFNGWGAESVTVVEAMDNVVPREDIDTQKTLAKALKKEGIDLKVKTKVEKVEKKGNEVHVTTDKGDTLVGDLLVVAIGRGPVTDGMDIEKTNATIDRDFVQVDEYCRTGVTFGNGGVQYAVGDVIPTLGLAHASFAEGMMVAEQIAGKDVTPIDYKGVPKVYYCEPEIGAVGWTEQELKEEGIEYEKSVFPFSHNARAQMLGGTGHVKVLAKKDGKVMGVHIVGKSATDLIAEGEMIYNWEALPSDVAQFVHAHPSLSEAVGEAHMQLAGRALHG